MWNVKSGGSLATPPHNICGLYFRPDEEVKATVEELVKA